MSVSIVSRARGYRFIHRGRSFCPVCQETIRAFDTIPLLSYLFLRGRCRHCKTRISALYPCVELATALLFLVMSYRFGLTLEGLLAFVFVSLLVPIAVIDAQHYIIPNVLIVTGLILGFIIVSGIAYQRGDVWYLPRTAHRCGCRRGSVVVDCCCWERDFT